MKKSYSISIALLIFILLQSCATILPEYKRNQIDPEIRNATPQFNQLVGECNGLLKDYEKRVNEDITKYNKIIKNHERWSASEITLNLLGALASGGIAIGKGKDEFIALPISITSLMTTFSSSLRLATLSKVVKENTSKITERTANVQNYEKEFETILTNYNQSINDSLSIYTLKSLNSNIRLSINTIK